MIFACPVKNMLSRFSFFRPNLFARRVTLTSSTVCHCLTALQQLRVTSVGVMNAVECHVQDGACHWQYFASITKYNQLAIGGACRNTAHHLDSLSLMLIMRQTVAELFGSMSAIPVLYTFMQHSNVFCSLPKVAMVTEYRELL